MNKVNNYVIFPAVTVLLLISLLENGTQDEEKEYTIQTNTSTTDVANGEDCSNLRIRTDYEDNAIPSIVEETEKEYHPIDSDSANAKTKSSTFETFSELNFFFDQVQEFSKNVHYQDLKDFKPIKLFARLNCYQTLGEKPDFFLSITIQE